MTTTSGVYIYLKLTRWYFGHATVGPYSLVWYDILSNVTDTRFVSEYLVKDGEILRTNKTLPSGRITNL